MRNCELVRVLNKKLSGLNVQEGLKTCHLLGDTCKHLTHTKQGPIQTEEFNPLSRL